MDPKTTQEHMRAFGMIANRWAVHEVQLMWILGGMLKLDEAGTMVTFGRMQYPGKRDTYLGLIDTFDYRKGIKTKARELIGALRGSFLLRNDVCHCMWTDGDKPGTIRPIQIQNDRGKVKLTGLAVEGRSLPIRDYTAPQLFQEVAKISKASWELAQFAREHLGYQPEWWPEA